MEYFIAHPPRKKSRKTPNKLPVFDMSKYILFANAEVENKPGVWKPVTIYRNKRSKNVVLHHGGTAMKASHPRHIPLLIQDFFTTATGPPWK